MASKRQLKHLVSSLRNRNWDSYSELDNAKYLKRKLKIMDNKIYKYLEKGKVSMKQVERLSNKMIKQAQTEIEKIEFESLPKYQQNIIKKERRKENNLTKAETKALKEINKIKLDMEKTFENNNAYNKFTSAREFQNIGVIDDFRFMIDNIKHGGGEITKKEFLNYLKQSPIGREHELETTEEKLATMVIDGLKETLKDYYGVGKDVLKDLSEQYDNVNWENKLHLQEVLRRFEKGKNKYKIVTDDDDDISVTSRKLTAEQKLKNAMAQYL